MIIYGTQILAIEAGCFIIKSRCLALELGRSLIKHGCLVMDFQMLHYGPAVDNYDQHRDMGPQAFGGASL